jgi:tetratricopeptide (TPR) repeat protein
MCALFVGACNSAPQPVVNSNSAVATPQKAEKTETVIAHSTENQTAPANIDTGAGKTKWTQSGDPIDTSSFDTEIARAEKVVKSKPDDTAAKKALSEAYFKRADALTKARQYASALGDYRRSLKYDPDNAQAKEWIDQIIEIYGSLGRESPPEGQEPPPLPYKP